MNLSLKSVRSGEKSGEKTVELIRRVQCSAIRSVTVGAMETDLCMCGVCGVAGKSAETSSSDDF